MVEPRSPSMISSRQGQMLKVSEFGQGICQKVDDGRLGQSRSHHAGEKREVVVLYQDNWIVLRGFLHHRIGEALIHGDIMLPVAVAKNRPDEGDVA